MNVLVVDDDYAIREALDRALRANGYDVELANDGT
jgi:DNA-binding response OmpR family regulator